MPIPEGVLIDVLASGLAPRVAAHSSLLVVAPPEFWPERVVHTAFGKAFGTDGFTALPLPADAGRLVAELEEPCPLLVTLSTAEDAVTLAAARIAAANGGPPPEHVCAVLVTDDPWSVDTAAFEVVVDHRDLVASDDVVRRLAPEASDFVGLHELLHETGGVPALLAAGPDQLPARCAAWAERMLPVVLANPVLAVHIWTGRAQERTIAAIAERVTGRTVPLAEVRRVRMSPALTVTSNHDPAIPDLVAYAMRRLVQEQAPGRVRRFQEAIREGVQAPAVGALEAIRLLTVLSDWPAIDRRLAGRLHLLMFLTRTQRAIYARLWPQAQPAQLPHLAAAHDFVAGAQEGVSVPGVLSPWLQLATLLRRQQAPKGSLADEVRQTLADRLLPGHGWDFGAATQALAEVESWLSGRCQRLVTAGVATRADDAALLILALVGTAEAAVRAGAMASARTLVGRAWLLMSELGEQVHGYPEARPLVLAHLAFTWARAGADGPAAARLAEYDAVVAATEPPSTFICDVAAVARCHLEASRGASPTGATLQYVDPLRDFAPEESCAVAIHVLLRHGPEAAIEWMQTMITRTTWAESPTWAWWPLHYMLALLHARCGNAGLAEHWLVRAPLPPALGLVVRAAVHLAAGRVSMAEQLATEVSAQPELSTRWRMLALGVRLAALVEGGAAPSTLELSLASEHWDLHVGTIAFFDDRARALILPRLPEEVRSLPGLALADAPAPVRRDVRLTPRQKEVLAALETDATMSDIAKGLFLSPETVRSTSKELYRRLGVHDRNSAVQVGRVLGLL